MNDFDFENIKEHLKKYFLNIDNQSENNIDELLTDKYTEIKVINLSYYQKKEPTKSILEDNNIKDFLILVFTGEERSGDKSWAFSNNNGELQLTSNKGLMSLLKYLKLDYQEAIADHLRKNENKALVEECINEMIIYHEKRLAELIESRKYDKKEIPSLVQHRRI